MASFLFPPHPVAMVDQVAQTVFGKLGRALEETAVALRDSDPERAERALQAAHGIDEDVEALEGILAAAGETARFAPARHHDLPYVHRYEQAMPQIDSAVRDTRVLVRFAARQVRAGERAPQLADAVRELADAVWVLAAQYEHPDRPTALRELAFRAARAAEDIHDREPSLMTTQIVAQVRSVAVDLVRAAESLTGAPVKDRTELPTEELLAAQPGLVQRGLGVQPGEPLALRRERATARGVELARTARARSRRARGATCPATAPSTRNVGNECGVFVLNSCGRCCSGSNPVRRA